MIHVGDCIEVMRTLPADSVDAVVTDPPYGLEFMGKGWDKFGAEVVDAAAQGGFQDKNGGNAFSNSRVRYHSGAKAGQSFQAWCQQWGTEALRVTKPGGYLLAFGGTRTHHRLVCGLEDAGWIIRDELTWVYASGFPKGKANLKPAHEPIVLARKPGPLRPLGIDAARIEYVSEADKPTQEEWNRAGSSGQPGAHGYAGQFSKGMKDAYAEGKIPVPSGRWPSNLLLSDPELFDEPNPEVVGSGATASSGQPTDERGTGGIWHEGNGVPAGPQYGDSGGYSRFFIVPKADRGDREPVLRGGLSARLKTSYINDTEGELSGLNARFRTTTARENVHPTVKPVDLMRHLIRLVTPPGGLVLDPFLGSGTTALAAELEGFPWIGIEKEPEYVAIAEARLNGTQRGMGLNARLSSRGGRSLPRSTPSGPTVASTSPPAADSSMPIWDEENVS